MPNDTRAALHVVPQSPHPDRVLVDLIRSVIGHAEGHEVEAVGKIRALLEDAGEATR